MGAALAACLVLLSGCDLATSSTDVSLSGYWKSTYGDGFELSGNTNDGFLYTQYDNASRDISFAGTVVNNPDFDASTGYIILWITNGGTGTKTEGYYYAGHWKNLSGSVVASAGAYNGTSALNDGMPTIAGAIAEYTVANGYYGYYGEYELQ